MSVDVTVRVPRGADRVRVLGAAERNLKMLREALGIGIVARDETVSLSGQPEAVAIARDVLDRLTSLRGEGLNRQEVLEIIGEESLRARRTPVAEAGEPKPAPNPMLGRAPVARSAHRQRAGSVGEARASVEAAVVDAAEAPVLFGPSVEVYATGRTVRPMSANQAAYLEAIRTHDLVFATGPAGTGKTYLAVAAAVHLLRMDKARRIVLVRPAVEAGEKLGFLPGDLAQKVNPYLRPLFDALHDMMDLSTARRFVQTDVVEIVPLAFMRGRTLSDSVIILDEAQNTTRAQMKMFLTRLGHRSKMVVTGDMTQTDLANPADSGLLDAFRRLGRVPGIAFVQLQPIDVVRHELVQRIVEVYGEDGGAEDGGREPKAAGTGAGARKSRSATPKASEARR